MGFLKFVSQFLVILWTASSVHGSLCSKENRTQDLTKCLDKTRELMYEPNLFWFGSNYTTRCPQGEASGVFCANINPNAQSIHTRLFSSSGYTAGFDRFMELQFQSEGKNYNACGNSYQTTESWSYDADPLSDTVVHPWYVKHFPNTVKWTYTTGEYFTLMVYDAGFMTANSLYINILNDDIDGAEVIRPYGQPLIGRDIKNPLVFLLFKQNGVITLTDEWKVKMTTGNIAGAWTIEEFTTAVNMQMDGLKAVNWIVVTGDEWAAQTMLDRGGPYALCPLYATKALLMKPRPFIPSDTELTVWIDFEFMVPEDHTITVCCKTTMYKARNFTLNPIGGTTFSTWDVRTETPHVLTFTKLGLYSQSQNFTGDMYTVISLDPDVPSPSAGTEERPILHGLVTNIVNGDLKQGHVGQHWSGPTPPDDLPHYYYTLLYKQQAEINATDLRFNYAGDCSGGLAGRCLYDINSAVSENNLTLVGATWFKSEKDAYVLKRQLDRNGSVEAEVCQGQTGYRNPCTTSSSAAVLPSLLTLSILFLFSLF